MSRFLTRLKVRADVTVTDVQGHLSSYQAALVLIINLILPGIGTIISVRFVKTRKVLERQNSMQNEKRIKTSFIHHVEKISGRGQLLGLLQLITFPLLLFGWIWALYTSIKMIQSTNNDPPKVKLC